MISRLLIPSLLCLVCGLPLQPTLGEETSETAPGHPGKTVHPPRQSHPLTRAINGEMKDIANAIRSLDQSYYIRGYRSKNAWTAGSAYFDYHSRGVTPPAPGQPHKVLPPPPVNLSGCERKPGCPHCEKNSPCPSCQKGCDS